MNCYVMTRKGTFNPKRMTSNQCKVQGHNKYNYDIAMLFSPKAKLDKNAFLIDHQDVDDCIQKCLLVGSCEQMHVNICRELRKLFKTKKIPVTAIRTKILPEIPVEKAFLTYIWTSKPMNSSILTFLS